MTSIRNPKMILKDVQAKCKVCGTLADFENVRIKSMVTENHNLILYLSHPFFCLVCGILTTEFTLARGNKYDLIVTLREVNK